LEAGGLQKLIDICVGFCQRCCLDFNAKKSKVMIFGEKYDSVTLESLYLYSTVIETVSDFKYLGVSLCSGKSFGFSAGNDLRSFYRSYNSLLSVTNRPNEQVLMKLLYANCIPVISYACAVKDYKSSDMTAFNTAINMAIRKIFSFSRSESTRHLREMYNYKSIYEIFATAKSKFSKAAVSSSNSIISHLANCFLK